MCRTSCYGDVGLRDWKRDWKVFVHHPSPKQKSLGRVSFVTLQHVCCHQSVGRIFLIVVQTLYSMVGTNPGGNEKGDSSREGGEKFQ